MSVRIKIDTESAWLARRREMLTASDSAAVLGCSPWKSIDEVYDDKVGIARPKDIGDKPCVRYGKMAEEHIRALFELDFPQMSVDYHQFDIIQCTIPGYEFMGATLDGEVYDALNAERGILEVKTGSFRNSQDLRSWDSAIPPYYYTQILHQLACMDDASFVIVSARLKREPYGDEDDGLPEIVSRYYRFRRNACDKDVKFLMSAEKKFWSCVQERERPATKITI